MTTYRYQVTLIAALMTTLSCGDTSSPTSTTPPQDPCATASCAAQATCAVSMGAAVCTCMNGYSGDGTTCADINECATDNGGCAAQATCTNTPGARSCACRAGWRGDGVTCTSAWSQVKKIDADLGRYGLFYVVGLDRSIYFANDNTPDSAADPPALFKSLDVTSGAVRDETINPDQNGFCACGLSSIPLASNNKIYYIANSGQVYDPSTRTWGTISYPQANRRGEPAAAVLAGKIYQVGGRAPDNTRLASAQSYDPQTNSWYADLPALAGPSYRAVLGTAGGKLHLLGGQGTPRDTWSIYDPVTNRWTDKGTRPGLSDARAAHEVRGRLYVLATQVQIYDPAADTWQEVPLPDVPQGGRWSAASADDSYFVIATSQDQKSLTFFRYAP